MIGNLVGRYETYTKPTDILATRKLAATTNICDTVVIAFVITIG